MENQVLELAQAPADQKASSTNTNIEISPNFWNLFTSIPHIRFINSEQEDESIGEERIVDGIFACLKYFINYTSLPLRTKKVSYSSEMKEVSLTAAIGKFRSNCDVAFTLTHTTKADRKTITEFFGCAKTSLSLRSFSDIPMPLFVHALVESKGESSSCVRATFIMVFNLAQIQRKFPYDTESPDEPEEFSFIKEYIQSEFFDPIHAK